MSFVYHNGIRYDYDGDVTMWNTITPFLPAEIITIIGIHCDRPTLKALRCADQLCKCATQPIFNTFFHQVTLRHNIGGITSSAQNLLAIATDKVKCKLVTKMTLIIQLSPGLDDSQKPWFTMPREDMQGLDLARAWRDWLRLNSPEQRHLIDRELDSVLWKSFARLTNCVELEIQGPESSGDPQMDEVASVIFTYGVWFVVFIVNEASYFIQALTTRYNNDCLKIPLLPAAVNDYSIPSKPLWSRLTKVDLCIHSQSRQSWRHFFSSIVNVEELSLRIGPTGLMLNCGGSESVEKTLFRLSERLPGYSKLVKLRLDVDACGFNALCACLLNAYSRVVELRLHAYSAHFSQVLQLVTVLHDLSSARSRLEYAEVKVKTSYWRPWLDDEPTWESEELHRKGKFITEHNRSEFLEASSRDLYEFFDKISDDNFEADRPHHR